MYLQLKAGLMTKLIENSFLWLMNWLECNLIFSYFVLTKTTPNLLKD